MTSKSIWQRQNYFQLSSEQIECLQEQGCTCNNWSDVKITADFNTDNIYSTHFSGQIRLAAFNKNITFFGGISRPSGIYNASLHNCIIGNNVFINNVKNYIANYIIENNAIIENIDILALDSESSFGNGTKVNVVNESGQREVAIYDRLTAQIAYILAFYRHKTNVINKLQELITEYSSSLSSTMGIVGNNALVTNSHILKNVKIGAASVIEGANRIENVSINSNAQDSVYIGPGTIIEDSIISSGAKISDNTIITKCFVGQSSELSRQCSAENSLFFANCEALHSEACSIFAGPYTVTHHKSTLLIAGLFSFFNAGSGTNQSNHMYKLGPVHQGIVERGSKTGSDSYMLWPSRIGAFSGVIGKHLQNLDTSELPFSYIIE